MADTGDVVVWLDPGLVTGLAWWDEHNEQFGSWQYEADDLFSRLDRLQGLHGERLRVGYEKYIITRRPGTAKPSMDVIAQVDERAAAGMFTLLPSVPSSGRKLGNVVFLRRLGWYKPGKVHANDAAQHTLAYLLREGLLPPHLMKKALHAEL